MGWTCWHFEELWWQIKNMHFSEITLYTSYMAFSIFCGRLSLYFWANNEQFLISPWGSVAETAVLRSALRWKCVDLFLMVIMNLSWSERWLFLLYPLLHTEVWEEETDFSLCRLDRIWRERRLKTWQFWTFSVTGSTGSVFLSLHPKHCVVYSIVSSKSRF